MYTTMEKEIKQICIVLKNEDSGESDRILTLLSPEIGKFYAKIKGVKKAKAKLSYASLPFCLGEYFLLQNGNSKLVLNCNHIDSFSALTSDLNRYYAGAVVLEISDKLSKENQNCSEIFIHTINALKVLCYKPDIKVYSVLAKFLIDILKSSGFGISISENINIKKEVYFDFYSGKLTNNLNDFCYKLSTNDSQNFFVLLDKNTTFESENFVASKNLVKLLSRFLESEIDEEIKSLKVFIK